MRVERPPVDEGRPQNGTLENHKVAAPSAIFRMVMRGAQVADGD